MPLPSERPKSGSFFGPSTIRAMTRMIMSSGRPMLKGMVRFLPPDGGVKVCDFVNGLGVDPAREVFPAVVADDEDDVALVQLVGDAHGDLRDRPAGDAREDPFLVEQLPRP